MTFKIGDTEIGHGEPAYIIGEIGINHNGEMSICRDLIDSAARAGCNAVKFQKRTPEICVPKEQQSIERDTPWGRMTYLDYKRRIEFGESEFKEIDTYCKQKGIHWFASCWDKPSVDFMEGFDPVAYKVASASITDDELLKHTNATGRSIIISTGMSTMEEIGHAVSLIANDRLAIMHTTSTYPCKPEELNLQMIGTLRREFPGVPIGYSGHETGLQTTVAAVTLGSCLVERHITLDRAMWGTDQSASVEPDGLRRLVRDIRVVEMALGDGVKRVYESEEPIRKKLRAI